MCVRGRVWVGGACVLTIGVCVRVRVYVSAFFLYIPVSDVFPFILSLLTDMLTKLPAILLTSQVICNVIFSKTSYVAFITYRYGGLLRWSLTPLPLICVPFILICGISEKKQ